MWPLKYKPRWLVDLEPCGMSYDEYRDHQKFYLDHHVNVGHKTDRAGLYHGEFTWLHVPKSGPSYISCRTTIGSTIDMLRDHDGTLKSFRVEVSHAGTSE